MVWQRSAQHAERLGESRARERSQRVQGVLNFTPPRGERAAVVMPSALLPDVRASRRVFGLEADK